MTPLVSVIVPAHNPRWDYLQATLEGLRKQSLPFAQWELLVVDNKSEPPLRGRLDLAWKSDAAIVEEGALGLSRARVAGFRSSVGEVIVLVDDDNVLAPDYLERALEIGNAFPFLGAWSGQIALALEDPNSAPPARLRYLLCERAVGDAIWSNDRSHVAATPWGAGMCIRRKVAVAYANATQSDARRLELDLQGNGLVYGGDTDIAYLGCSMGLGMGVFPTLRLMHLIPRERCTVEYLLRNLEAHAYSEILHHWVLTGVLPPRRSDLRGRLAGVVRSLASDSLGRRVTRATQSGYARARSELARVAKPREA